MAISPVPRSEPPTGFQPWVDSSYDPELYPCLTLHQFGFYINAVAENQYDLRQYHYIRLYWDAATRRMSARFFNDGEFPGARKARSIGPGRGRRVACVPFFKQCGITAEDYGKHRCTDESRPGVLVIQLRKH